MPDPCFSRSAADMAMGETRPVYPASFSYDNHIHTSLCNHATGEMEEYVLAGIEKGLKKIIFLEHMEEGIVCEQKTWLSEEDFDRYFTEGRKLQHKYRDRIDIGLGVECGFNPDYAERLKERLLARQWDQVGISCHFLKLDATNQHINLFSRKKSYIQLALQEGIETLLDRYFKTLMQAVQCLPGTLLCHLDGALRFVPQLQLTEGHYQQIGRLLEIAKKKRMSVEINSSGLDIRGEQFPNSRILTMVFSAELPCLFGSDAHRPEEVGRHFDALNGLLPSIPALR